MIEERIEESAWSSKFRNFKIIISFPKGRHREIWN